MKLLQRICLAAILGLPAAAMAQSTYIMPGDKATHFIERLEIKQQTNTDLNFSTLKPFNRQHIVEEVEFLDSARLGYRDSLGQDKFKEWTDLNLTEVDEYNMRNLLMNNSEWVKGSRADFESNRPILNAFYKTKANMIEVNNDNFFLAINPMIQFQYGKESDNKNSLFLNSRGVSARGLIAKKIGFSTFLTDNQERGPAFFNSYVNQQSAVPGYGFYKRFKTTAFDYLDARGYVTFPATKFINIQFGYDKNFIGNGQRSLFLSDWGNSYLFAKINTRIWKLNYQNLFMELQPSFKRSSDTLLDKKYAAMHHLSMNVTKWLNIGFFEGVVFGRRNHFEFGYLNPIIFYRHIEGQIGSPDNALMGFDFKANMAHAVQLYGQFLLDEFRINDIRNHPKSWANKFGIQAGLKYMDAFSIKNLDLQFEANRVRPFTYTHFNGVSNYTHYNQPLAHPLGANFQEFFGQINYQPTNKLNINIKGFYYYKGLDPGDSLNLGGNIFKDYSTRSMGDGLFVGIGDKATVFNGIMHASYELRNNLFFDLTGQYRTYKLESQPKSLNSTIFTAGVRLNMAKRFYDF